MLWLVALIVWIILMIAWLGGSGYGFYSGPNAANPGAFVTGSLVPWACVFILGLFMFGAFGAPISMPMR